MDSFTAFKQSVLNRKDKSNKSSIDKEIIPLIHLINKNNNYCTTSSCSGRIVLFIEPKSGIKKDFRFLYETHEAVKIKALRQALKRLPKETAWFRFEPLILHVACSTTEAAQSLLTTAQRTFKHSDIMTLKKRPILEIRGSEFLEAPIAQAGKLIVSEAYIKTLIREANKKLKKNKERIEKFTQKVYASAALSVKKKKKRDTAAFCTVPRTIFMTIRQQLLGELHRQENDQSKHNKIAYNEQCKESR